MSMIVNLIYFVLILSVIIIVHELGHLMAAKKFGVYCKEFSIGMGPVLWQKQGKETAWSIRALPIGGFVAMAGEEGEEDNDEEDGLDIPFERTINGIKPWKQIVVMAAGAIMNIVLAWVLFVGITAYQGAVAVPAKPQIEKIQENSVADKAGFKIGDEILEVKNSKETLKPETGTEVSEFIQYYPEKSTFTILRDNKEISVILTPAYDEEQKLYVLGVYYPASDVKQLNLLESIPYGTDKMVTSVTSIIGALGKLIQGVGLDNLSGPVGIYQVTAQITQAGLLSTLALVGLLSVNVGVMNLIPIPILDGGRIFIILIELLIGRKLNERVQSVIMMAGLLMIVALMVFATWNDIARLL